LDNVIGSSASIAAWRPAEAGSESCDPRLPVAATN